MADDECIGMRGVSRDGMMSFIAVRNSDDFKAIVVEGEPGDQLKAVENLPGMEEVFRTWVPTMWQ